MKLSEAVGKVTSAIEDLSSLHVQTYIGSVTIELEDLPDDVKPMDRIRDSVKEASKADGSISLVAEAYYQFDGDSYNFLAKENVPTRALEMHTAAVEAGIKTRRGLVELVKGAIA